MQSIDPSMSRKNIEQKLAELALNISESSNVEAANKLLELSNDFRYLGLETEIVAPFEKAAKELKAKLEAKLKALQEEAMAASIPSIEVPEAQTNSDSTDDLVPTQEAETTIAPEQPSISEETNAEPEFSEEETVSSEHTTTTKETAPKQKKSLNDKFAGGTIKFGLNDRIGLVKELFDGSQEDFNRVVSQLNTLSSIKEAMEFIETHISGEYDWEEKEEAAARFIAAVEQKFG
jgi:hypothetical protein